MNPAWRGLMRDLREHGECDLAVGTLDFTVVSIDLEEIGECLVALPYHPDFPELGAVLLTLSWESFGAEGLN